MATAIGGALKLTWDDYLGFPEDGARHEIIDGEHYVTASPVLNHQRVSRHIQFQLYEQIERQGKGEVFNAPTAVQLSDFDIVEPDLLVVLADHGQRLRETRVDGPPDLVVEILSPSTRRLDRELKMALYQRTGVSEYWIVDPRRAAWRSTAVRETGWRRPVCSASRSHSTVLSGVVVDLNRVWDPPWGAPR